MERVKRVNVSAVGCGHCMWWCLSAGMWASGRSASVPVSSCVLSSATYKTRSTAFTAWRRRPSVRHRAPPTSSRARPASTPPSAASTGPPARGPRYQPLHPADMKFRILSLSLSLSLSACVIHSHATPYVCVGPIFRRATPSWL